MSVMIGMVGMIGIAGIAGIAGLADMVGKDVQPKEDDAPILST